MLAWVRHGVHYADGFLPPDVASSPAPGISRCSESVCGAGIFPNKRPPRGRPDGFWSELCPQMGRYFLCGVCLSHFIAGGIVAHDCCSVNGMFTVRQLAPAWGYCEAI